ncbi:MAG: DUF945 family protein [Pseudomonadota bacterium]
MRRILALALLVLVPVLLAGPWLIGRQTVDYTEQALTAFSQQAGVTVITEARDGGWFRGELRHRLILNKAAARPWQQYFQTAVFGDQPAFLIETRLDNGPVAFSSLHRPRGSLKPALQRAVSRVWLDKGQDEMTALPVHIYSTVGIGGGIQLEIDSGEGKLDISGYSESVAWQGLAAQVLSSRDAQDQAVEASATTFDFVAESFGLKATNLTLGAATQAGRLTRAFLDSKELQFDEPALPSPEFYRDLQIRVAVTENDSRPNTRLQIQLGNYPLADGSELPVALDLSFEDLDGLALTRLPASQDAFFSWLQTLPKGETQMLEIASLTVGDGEDAAVATGHMELNGRALRRGDMEEILARSSGSVAIRMPIAAARQILVGDLAVLSAYMRTNGSDFEADLTLDAGKLSLNGTELFQF